MNKTDYIIMTRCKNGEFMPVTFADGRIPIYNDMDEAQCDMDVNDVLFKIEEVPPSKKVQKTCTIQKIVLPLYQQTKTIKIMTSYIQKDEFKKQVATEIIVRKNFIKALTIMRDNFPENGKRFDGRNFNKFNELMNDKNYRISKYEEYGIEIRYIGYDTVRTGATSIVSYRPDFSTMISSNGIMKYELWFNNNKVENHDAFVRKMDDFIKFQQDKINSLESISDEMISDFQKQWAMFETLSKELRDFPFSNYIDVPYVSNCPIYDKHL